MKIRYLGLLPSIAVIVWSIWYVIATPYVPFDFLRNLASSVIFIFGLIIVIAGAMWAMDLL